MNFKRLRNWSSEDRFRREGRRERVIKALISIPMLISSIGIEIKDFVLKRSLDLIVLSTNTQTQKGSNERLFNTDTQYAHSFRGNLLLSSYKMTLKQQIKG